MGKQNTADRKKQFLKAYENSMCNITDACKMIKINRGCFYKWIKNDSDFAQAVDDAEASLVDFCEYELLKKIKAGELVPLLFWLKCKGGYTEKQELSTTGEIVFRVERTVISQLEPQTIKAITHEDN